MQEIAQVFSFPDAFADKGRTDFDKGSLYDSDMRRQTGCILQGITLARIDQNVVAADDFFGTQSRMRGNGGILPRLLLPFSAADGRRAKSRSV